IKWVPLKFTTKLGRVGKAWDMLKLVVVSMVLALVIRPDIVHARGYTCGRVGLLLRGMVGSKLLFDMRSFWADQRIDGGLWDIRKVTDRLLFRYYKKVERSLIERTDHLITLTEASV